MNRSKKLAKHQILNFSQNFFDKELPSFGVKLSDPHWLTFFKIRERLAGQYRVGRVFIAGDAAHTHSPAGGQGMNTGFQGKFPSLVFNPMINFCAFNTLYKTQTEY